MAAASHLEHEVAAPGHEEVGRAVPSQPRSKVLDQLVCPRRDVCGRDVGVSVAVHAPAEALCVSCEV
jgi:hypothetical protein